MLSISFAMAHGTGCLESCVRTSRTRAGTPKMPYFRTSIREGTGYVIGAPAADSFNSRKRRFWVIRLSADLRVLWNVPVTEDVVVLSDIVAQKEGGGYVFGSTSSCFLEVVWLSGSGSVASRKSYQVGACTNVRMVAGHDGGYVIGTGDPDGSSRNFRVMKIDEEGNIVWQSSLPITPNVRVLIWRLLRARDGYILVGQGQQQLGDHGKILVAKIGLDGKELWRTELVFPQNSPNMEDAAVLSTGHVVISDYALPTISPDGGIAWRTYNSNRGVVLPDSEGGFSIIEDGGVFAHYLSGGMKIRTFSWPLEKNFSDTLERDQPFHPWWMVSPSNGNIVLGGSFGAQARILKVQMAKMPAGTPSILLNGTPRTRYEVAKFPEITVEITNSAPLSRIYYTLDGSDPEKGILYTGPFGLRTSATVRAAAITPANQALHARSIPVTFSAAKKLPTVAWNPPPQVANGSRLDSTVLNATADVPGTFIYQPPLGSTTSCFVDYPLRLQFDPDDGDTYYSVLLTNFITAEKYPQTITLNAPSLMTAGDAIALSAQTSSYQPVVIELRDGPGILRGDILTVTNQGTVTLRASQLGTECFAPAEIFTKITSVLPELEIRKNSSGLVLTAAHLGKFILEKSESLERSSWTEISFPMGSSTFVFSPSNNTTEFFRLRLK